MNPVHYSSNSNEWETPQDLFNSLDRDFHFTLDPCATKDNAKCKKYFTKEDDGLSKDWTNEIVFMNPPYGRQIHKWIEKAYHSKATTVCLIPARTDTSYWHDYCMKGEIRFIRGRIHFLNPSSNNDPAPFPSAIVIFRNLPNYPTTELPN